MKPFHKFPFISLQSLVVFVMFSALLFSCSDEQDEQPSEKRGDLINSEYITEYTASFIEAALKGYDVDVDIDIEYDVDAYRITYLTPGPDGSLTEASGALMIPKGTSDMPAISFQHGTETMRTNVASRDPISTGEGFAGMVSTSTGFITFLPDYLGLGVSEILHPYLHADLSAGAVTDMIRAGDAFCKENNITPNHDLYIGGYSEGGYVTLAAQREIESDKDFPFNLIASAPAAGPYDLYGTATYLIQKDEYPEPAFLAYLFTAYNDVYNWNRLDEIFAAPYADMMPGLFDGTKTTNQISSELPNKISELFTQDFISGFNNGTETEVINALKENTLLSWTPVTPIRFYHSNADEIVPYQNSLNAIQEFRKNGATNIELKTIDGLHHSDAAVPAFTDMIEWFDSLR